MAGAVATKGTLLETVGQNATGPKARGGPHGKVEDNYPIYFPAKRSVRVANAHSGRARECQQKNCRGCESRMFVEEKRAEK